MRRAGAGMNSHRSWIRNRIGPCARRWGVGYCERMCAEYLGVLSWHGWWGKVWLAGEGVQLVCPSARDSCSSAVPNFISIQVIGPIESATPRPTTISLNFWYEIALFLSAIGS